MDGQSMMLVQVNCVVDVVAVKLAALGYADF